MIYKKPFKTPVALLEYIEHKGISIGDAVEAERFLTFINYFRFKIYLVPFYDQTNSKYQDGTSFEDGVQLYRFDDELRDILFSVIGRIEIKLRTRLDQVATTHTDNPFWYLDSNIVQHNDSFREKLKTSFMDSKDTSADHFKKTYTNDVDAKLSKLPPFWIIAEMITFGQVLRAYKLIKKAPFNGPNNTNKLDDLAKEFGAKNLAELNNWILLIRDVRNRCAHHSRVWNFNFREPSSIPKLLLGELPPTHSNRIYFFVALLHKMDSSLQLDIGIKDSILRLFNKYPIADRKKNAAGFPVDWESALFWN